MSTISKLRRVSSRRHGAMFWEYWVPAAALGLLVVGVLFAMGRI